MSNGGRFMFQAAQSRKERAQTTTWLTPKWLLDRLGKFDYDPCAAPEPRPWPTARVMHDETKNRLRYKWFDRVFVNPPYGLSAVEFLKKLAKHNRGILLITLRGDTRYFHDWVWGVASSMLVLKGRPRFCYPDGSDSKGSTGGATALFSYGPEDAEILSELTDLGYYTRLDRSMT